MKRENKLLLAGLTAILLSTAGMQLSSESLIFTTSYPAPAGVYQAILTTGGTGQNTILARDNGNVGIRTTSPQGRLHVVTPVNTDANQPRFLSGSANTGDWNEILVGAAVSVYQAAFAPRYFNGQGAAGSARMSFFHYGDPATSGLSIIGGGNVGIGTTNPSVTLDVNGPIHELGASVPRGIQLVTSPVGSGSANAQCQAQAQCPSNQLVIATHCILWSSPGSQSNLQNVWGAGNGNTRGDCTYNCGDGGCTCQAQATCITP